MYGFSIWVGVSIRYRRTVPYFLSVFLFSNDFLFVFLFLETNDFLLVLLFQFNFLI